MVGCRDAAAWLQDVQHACPSCRSAIELNENGGLCSACGFKVARSKGVYGFLEQAGAADEGRTGLTILRRDHSAIPALPSNIVRPSNSAISSTRSGMCAAQYRPMRGFSTSAAAMEFSGKHCWIAGLRLASIIR